MKVGFIGLGRMGRGMAANVQKAGHALTLHDVDRQSAAQLLANGASWAETPRSLAETCDVIFTSLPTPADVEAVGFGPEGLVHGFRKGMAWFDFSTNAVDVVRRLSAELKKAGVDFLDAPISGGPPGAASGKLAIWVGGDKSAYDRFEPLLMSIGNETRYIGDIGAGTIAKLAHNCASITVGVVLNEVLTMGVKAGLDPLTLWDSVRKGVAGRSGLFDKMGTRVLPGEFDTPYMELRLVDKDIGLAVQLGRDVGVPMRLCTLASQEIMEAINRGWGKRDGQSVSLLQQERSGIPKISVPKEDIQALLDGD